MSAPVDRKSPGWAWLVLCLGALAIAAGCRDRGSDNSSEPARSTTKGLAIQRISTELLALDEPGKRMDLKVSLEEMVKAKLEKASALQLDPSPGGRRGARLKVTARLLQDGFSDQLHALVSARVTNTGSIPLSADVDALRPGAPDGGTLSIEDYVEHLDKALSDVIEALDQQARLLGSGDTALIEALGHEEADVRIAAARALGERQSREALEELCELLERERGQVGQAVIGALAMIGDPRAAPCLIQWAGADERRLLMILEPLVAVGGQDAEAFLDMIASGHDDPRVRRAAEASLRRLRRASPPASEESSTGQKG